MRYHFGLSGESVPPPIIIDSDQPEQNASQIAALNVEKRGFQKLYMDYWNSTAEVTGTGRPVDGVICPCAPHAAVLPNKYYHIAYSSFVNVLDYTSVVFPVTHADKTVDVPYSGMEFLSDVDQKMQGDCECLPPSEVDEQADEKQMIRRRMMEPRLACN